MHFGCVSAERFSLTQNNGQPTETANQLIVALLLNFSSLWQKLKTNISKLSLYSKLLLSENQNLSYGFEVKVDF